MSAFAPTSLFAPVNILSRAEAQEIATRALKNSPAEETRVNISSTAQAAAYVECRTPDGKSVFGCGLDTDVATASVRAILSAANGA